MKALSLFSGCGGDTQGMIDAGVDVIAFSEINKSAIKTHLTNHPTCEWINYNGNGDITKIPDCVFEKYKNIDIVFAGFPCQSFSNAGKKKSLDDPRGQLFYEFVRIVKVVKPKFIIGENVKGLMSRLYNGQPVFNLIQQTFNDVGYKFDYKIVNTKYYGIPQSRERLIFVGSLNSDFIYEFPQPFDTIVSIKNILENTLNDAYQIKSIPSDVIYAYDTNDTLKLSGEPHPFLIKNVKLGNISFGKRSSPNHGEIVDINKPCKTIICAYKFQPRLYVAIKNNNMSYLRTFTISELAQIQGFEKSYQFYGSNAEKITQIGNAISPKLVRVIVETLQILLRN